MQEYDTLDIKTETEDMSDVERDRVNHIYRELNGYWLIEEIKAKQRQGY